MGVRKNWNRRYRRQQPRLECCFTGTGAYGIRTRSDRDPDLSERDTKQQRETLDNALQGEIRRTLDRIKERTH
jgi:hypothetical protein